MSVRILTFSGDISFSSFSLSIFLSLSLYQAYCLGLFYSYSHQLKKKKNRILFKMLQKLLTGVSCWNPHLNAYISRCPHDDCHSPIQLPKMVEKIFLLLVSSISVNDRKLKWRVKRWVMGFLPPPGGPMAHAKFMSTMFLNVPGKRRKQIRLNRVCIELCVHMFVYYRSMFKTF